MNLRGDEKTFLFGEAGKFATPETSDASSLAGYWNAEEAAESQWAYQTSAAWADWRSADYSAQASALATMASTLDILWAQFRADMAPAREVAEAGGRALKSAPKSGKHSIDLADEARISENAAPGRGLDPGQNVLNMARKTDIKAIDRIVKEVKLSKAPRRLLYDEITKQDYSVDEIRRSAEEIKKLYRNK